MKPNLDRDEIETEDGDEIRLYYSKHDDSIPLMPSVTTVGDTRVSPEKDESIDGWKDHFDGTKPWKSPWWEDQMAYKGARGTLVHFALLSQVGDPSGDSYYHEVGDSDYGLEEYESMRVLQNWSKEAPSALDDEQNTPINDKHDGEPAWQRCMRDIMWCQEEFNKLWDARGLDASDTIASEEFVMDKEYGYAGQFDLCYENEAGDTVLCDLKCSSGIRIDYKIQLAAYARACPYDIDELEVVRVYPDKSTVEVGRLNGRGFKASYGNDDLADHFYDDDCHIPQEELEYFSWNEPWDRTRRQLEHQFLHLVGETKNVKLKKTLENTEQSALPGMT